MFSLFFPEAFSPTFISRHSLSFATRCRQSPTEALLCHFPGISIGSAVSQAVLQGSRLWQTDRPTDRPRYSVCNNRPHLCT